jgi:hypothetical protein
MVHESFEKLKKYCEQEEYSGWDNFDGLNSKMFKGSPLFKSKFLRLAWTQSFKRSPINFRALTFVPKGMNPKGLALFASGLVNSGNYNEAKALLDKLKTLKCSGYSEACWGYNFDWQSRGHLTTLGTPNIVTTVFVANAFFDYFEKTNEEESLEIAQSACQFFVNNLILFEDENSLCFGYMPGSDSRVHNVNMLGAALLGRIYGITKDKSHLEMSRKAMSYTVNRMNKDGSWFYGENHHQSFIDNFHTGFNLVSLNNWMNSTDVNLWEEELQKAYQYFLRTFWMEDGCPKYYHDSLYPIDIHCSAQGIITCLNMQKHDVKSLDLARKIYLWAVNNMQDDKGYFYYQKKRLYTNKISYMRWSQAWMFYALSMIDSIDLDSFD